MVDGQLSKQGKKLTKKNNGRHEQCIKIDGQDPL